jgi:hypothetical protein
MFITLNRIENSITGSYVNAETNENISFGVQYTEEKWKKMVDYQNATLDVVSMDELKSILTEFAVLAKDDLKTKIETICPDLYVQPATNNFYLKVNGRIINNVIPQPIVDRILKSVEKGIDAAPMIKACIRFMRNPNFSQAKFEKFAWYIDQTTLLHKSYDALIAEGYTPEIAKERATVFQVSITLEGLLCTYKVSTEVLTKFVKDAEGKAKEVSRFESEVDEDTGTITYKQPDYAEDRIFKPAVQGDNGDAFFMESILGLSAPKEGHRIKVGHIHYLKEWSQVNCNDDQSCVKGLHVGNLNYIGGYQHQGTVTHEVFVDPMDIGAIVQDNTGAIRVRRYFVYRSYIGPNKNLYQSSHYAKLTNDEWLKMKADVLATRETVAAEQLEMVKDIEAL